jgi:hypothetical protein
VVGNLEDDVAARGDAVGVVAVGDEKQREYDDKDDPGNDENAVASVGVDFVSCEQVSEGACEAAQTGSPPSVRSRSFWAQGWLPIKSEWGRRQSVGCAGR